MSILTMWRNISLICVFFGCCDINAQPEKNIFKNLKKEAVFVGYVKKHNNDSLNYITLWGSNELNLAKLLRSKKISLNRGGQYIIFIYEGLREITWSKGKETFSDSIVLSVINYEGKKFVSMNGLRRLDQVMFLIEGNSEEDPEGGP